MHFWPNEGHNGLCDNTYVKMEEIKATLYIVLPQTSLRENSVSILVAPSLRLPASLGYVQPEQFAIPVGIVEGFSSHCMDGWMDGWLVGWLCQRGMSERRDHVLWEVDGRRVVVVRKRLKWFLGGLYKRKSEGEEEREGKVERIEVEINKNRNK